VTSSSPAEVTGTVENELAFETSVALLGATVVSDEAEAWLVVVSDAGATSMVVAGPSHAV
jgi:hypothetical protein